VTQRKKQLLPTRYIPCKRFVLNHTQTKIDEYTDTEVDLALVIRAEAFLEMSGEIDTITESYHVDNSKTTIFFSSNVSYESQIDIDIPYDIFSEWLRQYREYWYERISRDDSGSGSVDFRFN
jgi:hypothetical protein